MSKKIKGGADPFPPYQYFDENGDVVGSDFKLVTDALIKADYEPEVVIDEWSIIEGMLSRKELDFGFQVQKTPEREKKYFFSKLLRNAETQLVTWDKDLRLENYGEIADKKLKIGVMSGYLYGDAIDNLPSDLKVCYDSGEELLKDIDSKKIDLGVFDKGVKEYVMKKYSLQNIYSVDNLTFIRPLYVVFANQQVCNDFNENYE